MRRTWVVLSALAVVLSLVLGACGGEEPQTPIRTPKPQKTASSPSPDTETTKKSEGCKLLTPAERRSIAGEKLNTVAPLPVTKGALVCTWVHTLSTPLTTTLKVDQPTGGPVVRGVPKRIDDLILSGRFDQKYSKRLQTAKKEILRGSEKLSEKQACKYFSLLVEVHEGKEESDRGHPVPGDGPRRLPGELAEVAGGVETELVYEEPGLQVSLALSQSVIRLGKAAHKRALKLL